MQVSKQLIQWYEKHQRDLPWRRTQDPYLIWLSEVILQQTRVDQGLPYYTKFSEAYPTVGQMAAAPEDDIMKLWQGLGYYSRARNMHHTAQLVVSKYDGIFPNTLEGLLSLKGIGPYTAAAIASLAFNLPHAVVDGNVYRVLARLYGIAEPINSTSGVKIFKQLADDLLDRKNPGTYNQALMEFGATWCKPANPKCEDCIFRLHCQAYKDNTVQQLPAKVKAKPVKERFLNYLFIRKKKGTFIKQRTENDIWKNLYDLPCIETPRALSEAELLELKDYKDLDAAGKLNLMGQTLLKHKLTHRDIYATFWIFDAPQNFTFKKNTIFEIAWTELGNFAISRLFENFLKQHNEK
jgi:A/G-specific adenine glycosylase